MFDCNVGSPKGKHRNTSNILLQFSKIHVQRKGWITEVACGDLLLKQATLDCLSLWGPIGRQGINITRFLPLLGTHTHIATE